MEVPVAATNSAIGPDISGPGQTLFSNTSDADSPTLFAVYPDLSSREMEVPVAAINRALGTHLPAAQIAESLARMALAGTLTEDGSVVRVAVPPTRSDVLHACDVAEVRCALIIDQFHCTRIAT